MWLPWDWAGKWFFFPCPPVFYCCSFIPRDLQREMEDNASMLLERATERLHPWAGRGGWGDGRGGTDRMGSRWPWFRPISTTEGGLKMATGPPLPLMAFRETPYHLTSTIHFNLPSPSSSSLMPNHTTLDVESIVWILTVLKMRRTKIRFKTIGCDLSDVPRI